MAQSVAAIRAEGLRKRFGETQALDDFSVEIAPGRIHGLLGPNGSGKTTAVRILTTLLRPDGGRAEVAGFDVVRHAEQVRYRIGLVGQNAAVDEVIDGRQNLIMFGRLYHLTRQQSYARADELLTAFGLAEAGTKPVGTYSGGMRRRLDLAASLILSPPVLFLDEPTTGLDPRGRNEVWQAIRNLVGSGTTVLLTTQYLEEADQLADDITVIDHGRVIAEGTPDELKARVGGDRISVVASELSDVPAITEILEQISGGPAEIEADGQTVSAPCKDRVSTLASLVRAIDDAGVGVDDISLRRPTLDEVFLHLTGSAAESSRPATLEQEQAA